MKSSNAVCFAINKKGQCKALDTDKRYGKKCLCVGYFACNFYRTVSEQIASRESANARLRSLPAERQMEIAEKYHNKYMPWNDI